MKALCVASLCMLGIVAPLTSSVAADSPEEAANRQLVLDYYRELEAATSAGKFNELPKIDAKYRDPGYIQHSVTATLTGPPPAAGGPPPKLLSIMAEGDKVIQVTSRMMPGADGKPRETNIFNMFRVKNGKLIEHWDAFGAPPQANAPPRANVPPQANVSNEQLAARLAALEQEYRRLKDVDDVEKLQRIYGYYVERGELDAVADLFSTRPEVAFEMSGRSLVGIENVRKMFSSATPFGVLKPGTKPDDYLHITAPIAGVVDVAADGATAQGRWYGLMFLNNAGMGGGAVWGVGIYENDYVKEDGQWKILQLRFDDIFLSSYDEKGWINTMPSFTNNASGKLPPPGRGRTAKTPFADLMPYHYKHPTTGR